MDMFMDKLAQKLTAQEMIQANMAADAEEMDKLKNTVKEYSECLEQVKKLTEEGISQLQNAKAEGSEALLDTLKELQKQLEAKLESSNENVHKEGVKIYRNVQAAVVEENQKQTQELKTAVKELVDAALEEKVSVANAETQKSFKKLKGIKGIAIVALLLAVASLAIQVFFLLNQMGILPTIKLF